MIMENIKEVIRDNLVKLRKDNKLTQLELAQKIGYSDKAISRWETGETTPDVETLNALSELYNVPISFFFSEYDKDVQIKQSKENEKQKINKIAISLLCIVSLWFIAIILFDVLNKIKGVDAWLSFIWAIPASFLLAIIFNSIWGKRLWTCIFSSFFSWTLILAIHLQFIQFSSFMIFIAGVPVQVVIILCYYLKRKKKDSQKNIEKNKDN